LKKALVIFTPLFLFACTPETDPTIPISTEVVTDDQTKQPIETIMPPENSLLIDWGSDNMDRGSYDYYWRDKNLVIDQSYSTIKRGDVVYFKVPDFEHEYEFTLESHSLSRVVGLPGETIEIREGQVFIDNKRLDTFYSEAYKTGMNEEEFFIVLESRGEEDQNDWREYFLTEMKPVKVDENSVFLLGDNWWRSVDSRYFGSLEMEMIEGEVLGYEK